MRELIREQRERRKPQKVYQYDLEGNFIQEFGTLTEASKTTGISLGSISRSSLNDWQAGGFQWKREFKECISKFDNKMSTPRKVEIGGTYTSPMYGKYKVMKKLDNNKGRNYKYQIVFENTGYVGAYRSTNVLDGTVIDYFYPSYSGVGYSGASEVKSKEFIMWQMMLRRCYANHGSSHLYEHVEVDERWHNFQNFKKDFKKIDGYDEDRWKAGELVLDKDLKQVGIKNKVYSLETCTFISPKENIQIRDTSYMVKITMRKGSEVYENMTMGEASEKTGWGYSTIRQRTADGQEYKRDGWTLTREKR